MFDSRRLLPAALAAAALLAVGVLFLRGRCDGGSSPPPPEETLEDEPSPDEPLAGSIPRTPDEPDVRPNVPDAGRTALRDAGAASVGPAGPDGSGTIVGLVLDAESIPLPGAAVIVRREEGAEALRGWFAPPERPGPGVAAARADFDGFFRIEGVPAGRYAVEAGIGGFAAETHRDVEVMPEGETWIEFRLRVGLSISGRVTDERGDPVGGAELSANGLGSGAAWATSAADGTYEIDGLRAGSWFVRASASGYVEDVQPGVRAGATGVDFRLGRAGGISGKVVWRGTGSPIAGASVRLEGRGTRGPGIGVGPFARGLRTTTAADGTFLLADVAPGGWVVHADAAGRAPETSRELTVSAGQRLEGLVIELGGGARVSGRVTAAGAGRPVEGAVVSIAGGGGGPGGGVGRGGPPWMRGGGAAEESPDGETSARTDGAGRFVLEHVGPGRRMLVASHAAHPQARVNVDVPETGEKGGIEIVLPAGGSIAGVVRDGRGNQPAGYSSVVAMASGAGRGSGPPGSGMMETGTAEIGGGGTYRIDGLRPGEYRVSAVRGMDAPEAEGSGRPVMSPPVEATVRSGETTSVDLVLGGGTSVFGTVLQSGEPLPGARVAFFPEGGGAFGGFASALADDEGAYRVDGLQPGAYTVRVEMSPLRVEIPDVAEFPLDLSVPEGSIGGRVVVATSGAPVPDVRVVVLRSDVSGGPGGRMLGFAGTARSGVDGSFEVGGLSEGAYTVQVSSEAWSPGAKPVTLPAGGRVGDLVLAVAPGSRIVGSVVDGEGNPVAGAMVAPADPSTGEVVRGGNFRGRISGDDGRFEIGGLPPGRYSVTATARGFAPSEPQVVEAGDGSAPIVIRLTAQGTPSGPGGDLPIRPGGDAPTERPRIPR